MFPSAQNMPKNEKPLTLRDGRGESAEDYTVGIQYNSETRLAIQKFILKEWEKMKGECSSADAFINHLLDVMEEKGFKSPLGKPLRYRSVRFQVHRAGIRFRRTDRLAQQSARSPRVAPDPSPSPAPRSSSSRPQQVETVPAPAGMNPVLHAILTDKTLSEEQRSALVKAFYGVR